MIFCTLLTLVLLGPSKTFITCAGRFKPNGDIMLGQHRRCWTNIKSTLLGLQSWASFADDGPAHTVPSTCNTYIHTPLSYICSSPSIITHSWVELIIFRHTAAVLATKIIHTPGYIIKISFNLTKALLRSLNRSRLEIVNKSSHCMRGILHIL